ncbi:MAG: GNAT family N-acetyltransferase [Bacteroidia bacterium]|nr:GNAT family N-acetyltransferase [Bacteroidia bacterium]
MNTLFLLLSETKHKLSMHIRTAQLEDTAAIADLYKVVAATGQLPHHEGDITGRYVTGFAEECISTGIMLVAEDDASGKLIAEIHAHAPVPQSQKHVLTGLILVVHPDHQGQKVGRTILTIFLEEIGLNRPGVGRVEVLVQESNERALALFQSMGFLIEGRLEMRARTADGLLEADIPMAWQNPNFDFDA